MESVILLLSKIVIGFATNRVNLTYQNVMVRFKMNNNNIKALFNLLKKVLRHFPFAYDYFLKQKTDSTHKEVINLLNGNSVSNPSNQKSVLHFSINKAATQHVKGVLHRFAKENNLIPIDYNGYAFSTDLPYLDLLSHKEMERYKHIFRPEGYLYSVLGGMVKNIDRMGDYHIILTIRDPRDILVSKYYSLGFSHAVPQKRGNKRSAFLRRRESVKKMNIDEFVLKDYPRVLSRFQAYQDTLLTLYDNVTLLRYEDMITDYRKWLKDLASGCGFSISVPLINILVEEFEKSRTHSEDKYRHIRKGVSGDYKEKLKPETISKLNEVFYQHLKKFGYQYDE